MMEDDLAIRELVYRYADAVCRRDETAWADTWAQDGLWSLPGAPVASGKIPPTTPEHCRNPRSDGLV